MMLFNRTIRNESICIVASTLPAGFISAQVRELGLRKIVVMSPNLEVSYSALKKNHPTIEIVLAPRGILRQCIYLSFIFIKSRLNYFRVVFFHECCLTHFDLLLMLIRPYGNYYPISTMSEWEEISFSEFKGSKMTYLIKFINFVDRFRYYRTPGVGGNQVEYAVSIKAYPESIIAADVSFARGVTSLVTRKSVIFTKNILFIAGKSFVADNVLTDLYNKLIGIARSLGYVCSVKDHPNPVYRLNMHNQYSTILDPFTPVELLEDVFDIIVGVSSTALLVYGERAVSLVKMIPEMSSIDCEACIKSFDVLSGSDCKLRFVSSIDEFEDLLIKHNAFHQINC
jgi:hypothetical protein